MSGSRKVVLIMLVETDAPLEMLVDRGVWNNGSDWDSKHPGKQRSRCLEEVFYGAAIDVKKVVDVTPIGLEIRLGDEPNG